MRNKKADHHTLATEIIGAVGGEENINKVIHCVTKLRFYLKDAKKSDTEKIESLDGCSGSWWPISI